MKTVKEYKERLRKMHPNIYKFSELNTDVTTYPATKRSIANFHILKNSS